MPDITYSVKVSEQDQDRLKALVNESGLNNKDFFINLLSIYEIQKAKETTPILTADIEELETLTRRINGIFVNASERINTLQREGTEERERQAETSQSTIALLQQRIDGMKQDSLHDEERIQGFIQDKERAEQHAAELQSRIKEFEQAAKDKQLLIEEYKSKNDTLTSIVDEYKAASEENKKLQSKNAEFTRKIEGLETQIKSLNEKSEERATIYAAELERLKDTLNIEHEKSMLELRTEHQRELQTQQELYNDKVKSLLERLETQTATPKTAPASKKKAPANKKTETGTEQTDTATS